MSYPSMTAQLAEDLRNGIITLRVDYFKTSGKWYAGDYVRLEAEILKPVEFDHVGLLRLIDEKQQAIVMRAYMEFAVVISELHYDDIPEYHEFFTRLYSPKVMP